MRSSGGSVIMKFDELKKILLEEKQKYDFEKAIEKVYQSKLTKQMKKAGKQSPGSLDCFRDEERTYSPQETDRYIQGTSYFENYQAMKGYDE